MSKYGDIEEHRHWQMRNIEFCLKYPQKYPDLNDTISIAEYLALSEDKRKLYKESPLLGRNYLPQIDGAGLPPKIAPAPLSRPSAPKSW